MKYNARILTDIVIIRLHWKCAVPSKYGAEIEEAILVGE